MFLRIQATDGDRQEASARAGSVDKIVSLAGMTDTCIATFSRDATSDAKRCALDAMSEMEQIARDLGGRGSADATSEMVFHLSLTLIEYREIFWRMAELREAGEEALNLVDQQVVAVRDLRPDADIVQAVERA